jgi:mRNA interferase RelE/StbE
VFRIEYNDSIDKDLSKLPKNEVKRILDKIDSELPARAHLFPELKGKYKGMRKFRIGNYRVVFDIVGDIVRIQRIGNRKDVYRN